MKIIFLSFMVVFFFSCKKDEADDIVYGYEYFPTNEGNFVTYDVVDVFHDEMLSPAHDTSRYQIKEIISETIIDDEGEETQKLRRFRRMNDTFPWILQDVWILKRTNRNAEILEENQRIVKMAFAISSDQYWDCNALNSGDEEACYYNAIYEPFSLPNNSFDSTVTVEKQDFKTFIEYLRSYEVYAPKIGKIVSVQKDIRINNGDILDVAYGTELFYTAINWGVE